MGASILKGYRLSLGLFAISTLSVGIAIDRGGASESHLNFWLGTNALMGLHALGLIVSDQVKKRGIKNIKKAVDHRNQRIKDAYYK